MDEKKIRTEVGELGEFKLIDRLTKPFETKNPTTTVGIGDDCAVITPNGDKMVVTTDLLLEGIHFDLTYFPLKHLGYKAVVVNLSDVYAMNAIPSQITVSIGISKRFGVEDLEELYAGIKLACDRYEVDLIGGDTSSSYTGLTISITAIGHADAKDIVYRNGAQINDLICVSGNLGAAYMGLQLLEREKRVFVSNSNTAPQLKGYDYILERILKPEAGRKTINALHEKGITPTAMIDISDGLSSELLHICKNSNKGCRVYLERIPIDEQTVQMANEFGIEPSIAALNGGEDYELLFTVPITDADKIKTVEGISIIGHITDAAKGAFLVTPSEDEVMLTAQGWNAFTKE